MFTVDAAAMPVSGAGHVVVLYRNDAAADAFATWRGPLPYAARIDVGELVPADDLVLVVIDPLGRRGAGVEVT